MWITTFHASTSVSDETKNRVEACAFEHAACVSYIGITTIGSIAAWSDLLRAHRSSFTIGAELAENVSVSWTGWEYASSTVPLEYLMKIHALPCQRLYTGRHTC